MPRQNNGTNASPDESKLPLEQPAQSEETLAASPTATETGNTVEAEGQPKAGAAAPTPPPDPLNPDQPTDPRLVQVSDPEAAASALLADQQAARAKLLAECRVLMLGSVAGSTPPDSTTGLPPEFSLNAGDRIAVSYRLADEWEAAGLCRILDEN